MPDVTDRFEKKNGRSRDKARTDPPMVAHGDPWHEATPVPLSMEMDVRFSRYGPGERFGTLIVQANTKLALAVLSRRDRFKGGPNPPCSALSRTI